MPAVFRAVRGLSNIDEADYMMSLAGECLLWYTFMCAVCVCMAVRTIICGEYGNTV